MVEKGKRKWIKTGKGLKHLTFEWICKR